MAQSAIDLGLDREGVVDVRRQSTPSPDIELAVDASAIAYVEQTMVMDQAAHRLTLDIEALNTATRREEDSAATAALKAGMLNLRLGAIPIEYYTTGLPIEDLAAEVRALARSLKSDTRPINRISQNSRCSPT